MEYTDLDVFSIPNNYWSKEQTAILISLYKKYPCLYDPRDPRHVIKYKRDEAYKRLLHEMREFKPNASVVDIKSKIRTLRNQLARERAKMLDPKTSGPSFSEVYVPKLWCYNQLQFLLKVTEDNQGSPSLDLTEEFHELDTTEDIKTSPNHIHSNGVREPSEEIIGVDQPEESEPKEIIKVAKFAQEQSIPCSSEQGKEVEFCRFLLSEMKTIQIEENLEDLKWEILDLVRRKVRKDRADREKIAKSCMCSSVCSTTREQTESANRPIKRSSAFEISCSSSSDPLL